MKFIFDLLMTLLPVLLDPFIRMLKLEALKVYVQGVDAVRRAFILGLLAVFGVMLLVGGFVMIHIALYFLLPWSEQTNAFVLLGAGTVYVLIPGLALMRLCSSRTWMKISGASKMAAKLGER